MSVETYNNVDENTQLPLFPGCMDKSNYKEQRKCANNKLLTYVYSNIQYPAIGQANNIEGTVIMSFQVNTDGSISDIDVKKDIGGACGQAATRVIESMNSMEEKWIPGTKAGEPVDMMYTLPVVFKLGK